MNRGPTMAAAGGGLWDELVGLEHEIAILLRLIGRALADERPDGQRRALLTHGRALRARSWRLRLLGSRRVPEPWTRLRP